MFPEELKLLKIQKNIFFKIHPQKFEFFREHRINTHVWPQRKGGWDYSMEKSLRDLVAKILGIALALMMGIGGVWSSISSGLAWGRAWRSVFICTFSVIGFTAISIARKATGQKKYE